MSRQNNKVLRLLDALKENSDVKRSANPLSMMASLENFVSDAVYN